MRFILLFLAVPAAAQTCGDLKISYQNAGCCADDSSCTVGIPNCDSAALGKVCYDGSDIVVKGLLDALGFEADRLVLKKNIIPDTNNAYDLGNAEYKIRDIYEAL